MEDCIIGAERAFVSQLQWQLRHKWDRQRSLDAWHREHPDISDEVFDKLYHRAGILVLACKLFNEPFNSDTVAQCLNRAKSLSESRSSTKTAT